MIRDLYDLQKAIMILALLIGLVIAKVTKYPSKSFLTAVAVIGACFSAVLAHSISPLLSMLPGFFVEWYKVGTFQSFPAYLLIASCSLLIFAVVSQVKRVVFLVACDLKTRYNTTIAP